MQQQTQARQVHKELQDTMAKLEAIRHEIPSVSLLNPGPLTRRLVDNRDASSAANANSVPGIVDLGGMPDATVSKVSTELAGREHISTATISKGCSLKSSNSCIMHTQATACARLAKSSYLKGDSFGNGADAKKLMDDVVLTNVLPVSAESAGLLPNRKDDVAGSQIVLEAILEAEVGRNAQESFAQPQNQIKH